MRFTALHSAVRVLLCVSLRRAYFTAAQSLPWQVSNQQRYKIFFWSCKSSTRLREPPELGKKSLQTIDDKSSSQYYRLLRDGPRCRCLIITSNSNSVFSSPASCQNRPTSRGLSSSAMVTAHSVPRICPSSSAAKEIAVLRVQ